jgi:hypothetical protein
MLWNGNECGKNKSNENFKTTIPSKNYDRPKTLENVESFKYFGSILTNDGRFTCETKRRIAMAKAAFNNKRSLFTSTLDMEFEEEASEMQHMEHSFIWC